MDDKLQNLIDYIDNHLSANVGVNTFYHYTSTEAFVNGITRESHNPSEEICLRATHCRFVNDPEEVSRGASIVKALYSKIQKIDSDRVKKVTKRYQDLFLISFSENSNSLPMWTTYANRSTGIAIGFKRLKSFSQSDLVVKCWYNPNEIIDLIDEDLHTEHKVLSFLCTALLPQMLKHEAYAYEKEIRFIGEFKDIPVKFREKNGYVIPYKEIFFPKEQIESITLGPCAHQEIAESSLRQLLDSRGLGEVKIIKSDIPYRNI